MQFSTVAVLAVLALSVSADRGNYQRYADRGNNVGAKCEYYGAEGHNGQVETANKLVNGVLTPVTHKKRSTCDSTRFRCVPDESIYGKRPAKTDPSYAAYKAKVDLAIKNDWYAKGTCQPKGTSIASRWNPQGH